MSLIPVFWLLVFLPALVALYFLKLKRKDILVSSTLLWKRSLEDFRVNAPFQKLRRNWLLLLQLFVFLLLIFAAWRPRVAAKLGAGRSLIVLVDNSASTSAKENEGTRLELEKGEALELVHGMGDADRMALFSFSSKTTPREPLTGDKARLESRIKEIEATALPTDLGQALRVVGSYSEALTSPEVCVIGDGCYGGLSLLQSEVKRMNIKFLGKSTALDNAGITEIDVRTSFEAEKKTEVFALVENFGRSPARITASFSLGDELKDAREVEVPAGGSIPILFDASTFKEGIAAVSLDREDALPLDNRAWVQISPPKQVSVLVVGKPNPWIDAVLKATSSVGFQRLALGEFASLLSSATPGELEKTPPADVLIFDREAISSPPPLPAIYLGCQPPLPPGLDPPGTKKLPVVVDWDRAHPVNRFLVYTDLYIEESAVFRGGEGYRSLVDSDGGSILGLVRYSLPGHRAIPAILVGFDILKSNWPLGHYSFPIFFSNAIAWLGSSLEGARKASTRTGEPLLYYPSPGEGLEALSRAMFRSPGGHEFSAAREASGTLVLSSVEEAGVYDLVVDGKALARFPVGLLSASESRLTPSPKVDFGDFTIEVSSTVEAGGRELWKWFALGALLFLFIEWQVYNRRAL